MDLAVSQGAADDVTREAVKFHRNLGREGSEKPSSSAVPRFVIDGNNKALAVSEEGRVSEAAVEELRHHCVYGDSGRAGQEDVSRHRQWNAEGSNRSPSGGLSEDEEEGEANVDGDGRVDGMASADNGVTKYHSSSSGSVQSSSEKSSHGKSNSQEYNSLSGNISKHQQQPRRDGQYEKRITIREPETSHARILQSEDVSTLVRREVEGENGCDRAGRKVTMLSPVESLRMHLSDPITGTLMDDAVILSCGHSYGSSGMQHINRTKACYKCGHPVSEDTVRPNLSLRSAIEAFRREEEIQIPKASRRRRDDQEQICTLHHMARGKGFQFPFVVSDRVVIKGNKRTPQRFVGRVAVVTMQCLNGWYVVKTLDNAESVKLQYRSLTKVADDVILNQDLSLNGDTQSKKLDCTI